MIISAVFSKPTDKVEEIFGKPFLRVRIKAGNSSDSVSYFAESFTQTQVFHEKMTEEELNAFIEKNAGTVYRNCIIRTESQEITILGNKKGKITRLEKKLKQSTKPESADKNLSDKAGQKNGAELFRMNPENLRKSAGNNAFGQNRTKNYLIPEGKAVPFLVLLGIMTSDGKVIKSKYDKFKQINRFLEFIDDVINQLEKNGAEKAKNNGEKPAEKKLLRIVDFGCGKSYLTFAVHYYLTEIRKTECEIFGLDLKEEVIAYCNKITEELHLDGLQFMTGDIADYAEEKSPDLVITLHACDTATDYALDYAVKHNCRAILSVPCCQHEINGQLDENIKEWKKSDNISEKTELFKPLLKYGIIREKFSALLTDAVRGEYLESEGYAVQLLEFIDMEHTPKNILIRAVKKNKSAESAGNSMKEAAALTEALKLSPKLKGLLEKSE